MKIELPSPRKPAPVTPKQGSLYHEMGKSLSEIWSRLKSFCPFQDKTKQKLAMIMQKSNTVPALHLTACAFLIFVVHVRCRHN